VVRVDGGNSRKLDRWLDDVRTRFDVLRVDRDFSGLYAGRGPQFGIRLTLSDVTHEQGQAEEAIAEKGFAPFGWSTAHAENVRPNSDRINCLLSIHPGWAPYDQDQLIVAGIDRHTDQVVDSAWFRATLAATTAGG
jgi:hypothetical protein